MILDDIFGWYRVVPIETWEGRILILAFCVGGVLLLRKGFRFQKHLRLRCWLSGAVLLMGAAVLANIEVRRDTARMQLGTQFQVHLRNHNLRLL